MVALYLASASPRRRELLTLLDIPFQTLTPAMEERYHASETPPQTVLRLAEEKAQAGVRCAPQDLPVLGADTLVVLDGQIFGKPADAAQACAMLQRLSGQTHQVMTAIALADSRGRIASELVVSRVLFRPLTDTEIRQYVATQEPLDKAGAYAIQGRAGRFVREIHGSYSAIVGLPLLETELLWRQFTACQNGSDRRV